MQRHGNHQVIIVPIERQALAQTLGESLRQRLIASILVPPNHGRDDLAVLADSRPIACNRPRLAEMGRRFSARAAPMRRAWPSLLRVKQWVRGGGLKRNSAYLAHWFGHA